MSVIDYYNRIANRYYEKKAHIDRSNLLARFTKYLAPGAKILDAGCGPGLDAKPFLDSGFLVDAIDGSEEMVKLASQHLNRSITCLRFDEIEFVCCFDGVWTNASLIHIPPDELLELFPRFVRAMKPGGYWYMSFRYGKGIKIIDGIPSYLQTKSSLIKLLALFPEFNLQEIWIRPTAHPELPDWLNCIVRKT